MGLLLLSALRPRRHDIARQLKVCLTLCAVLAVQNMVIKYRHVWAAETSNVLPGAGFQEDRNQLVGMPWFFYGLPNYQIEDEYPPNRTEPAATLQAVLRVDTGAQFGCALDGHFRYDQAGYAATNVMPFSVEPYRAEWRGSSGIQDAPGARVSNSGERGRVHSAIPLGAGCLVDAPAEVNVSGPGGVGGRGDALGVVAKSAHWNFQDWLDETRISRPPVARKPPLAGFAEGTTGLPHGSRHTYKPIDHSHCRDPRRQSFLVARRCGAMRTGTFKSRV